MLLTIHTCTVPWCLSSLDDSDSTGGRDGSAPRARPTAPPCTAAWGPETRVRVILAQCLVYQKVQERKAAVVPQQGLGAFPLRRGSRAGLQELLSTWQFFLGRTVPRAQQPVGGWGGFQGRGQHAWRWVESALTPELINFNILRLGFLIWRSGKMTRPHSRGLSTRGESGSHRPGPQRLVPGMLDSGWRPTRPHGWSRSHHSPRPQRGDFPSQETAPSRLFPKNYIHEAQGRQFKERPRVREPKSDLWRVWKLKQEPRFIHKSIQVKNWKHH